ncbi:MAG TPA: hypothetical protein VLY21_02865 [Nitrososphaerales archaeon]|nr:hypothetical protein [Nitrososphaerales archaeon]
MRRRFAIGSRAIGFLLILIILLGSFAVLVVIVMAPPARNGTTSSKTPVGAFYYLWYGNSTGDVGGLGSPGWNSSSYPGGGAVVDRPGIGYYVSDSNQTFARQVGQMQSAGLSFAVVSWWGPSSAGETGAINKAVHDLFRYLAAARSGFKIAVMVDAYNGTSNLSNSTLAKDYGYVYSDFVAPYSGSYFQWNGRPLLLFFNPVYPSYNDPRFTVRTVGNRPNPVEWTFWDAPPQYFAGQGGSGVNATNDEGTPLISSDGEVTVVPRIDSFYNRGSLGGSFLRFDPDLSTGLYNEQWSFVLNNSRDVKLVLIYSWNEYHERSEIEPHLDLSGIVSDSYLLSLTSSFTRELG